MEPQALDVVPRAGRALGLALAVGLGLSCRGFTPPDDAVTLPIADRPWAEGAPGEGWCGEASVQMAALHFGAWVPQAVANQLGAPKTPDLWEHDLPRVLRALELDFEQGPTRDVGALYAWVVKQLRAGFPVILGLKLVESEHPAWEVDHLVLVVGFSPAGLVLNTNMEDGQVRVGWAALRGPQGAHGVTLRNANGALWAFAVKGFSRPSGVRAEVLRETAEVVTLRLFPARDGVLLRDGTALDAGAREVDVPRASLSRIEVR